MKDNAAVLAFLAIGLVVGFFFGMVFVMTVMYPVPFKDGVVAATRGKATASLVTQDDGTTRWEVKRKPEEDRP